MKAKKKKTICKRCKGNGMDPVQKNTVPKWCKLCGGDTNTFKIKY